MSSPPAAPTPSSVAGKEPAKAPNKAQVAPGGTNPSTPAGHPTPSSTGQVNFLSPTAGRVAGKTLGKTLVAHHASPAVSTGTPTLNNVAAAAFDSPSFVGMEPGSSSMGLSMSGLGLGMGLSQSALGTSSMGKLDDAERRRRLEAVLAILSMRPGRVSHEGLERLARKLGMDMYSETSGNDRLMTLASGAYAIDVTFRPKESSVVQHVALQFHGLGDPVSETAPAAAAILQRDLQGTSPWPSFNIMLDRFADNLERLSRMDRLSATGANCFDAISGVHASLTRLYEHEKTALKMLREASSDDLDERVDMEVMTKKSGRPRMHARRRVGLSVEYWRDRRLVPSPSSEPGQDGTKPETEGDAPFKALDREREDESIYSLTLECEHCLPALYQSIRVTSDWLTPQIVKHPDASDAPGMMQDTLDWTEPPPPLIAGVEPDPMSTTAAAQSAHPHARFVARLEPSVVLPFNVAVQVMASVGIDITQDIAQMQAQHQTFDGLILGRDRQPSIKRTVTKFTAEGEPQDEAWEARTFVARPEFGREVTNIPFAHPRQLLPVLPILRQYVLVAKLLRSTTQGDSTTPAQTQQPETRRRPRTRDTRTELDDLLKMDLDGATTSRIIDVVLVQASPVPRLTVTLSSPGGARTYNAEILSNGELSVTSGDDMQGSGQAGDDSGKSIADESRAWTNALAIGEDLPLWAEWMRERTLGTAS